MINKTGLSLGYVCMQEIKTPHTHTDTHAHTHTQTHTHTHTHAHTHKDTHSRVITVFFLCVCAPL